MNQHQTNWAKQYVVTYQNKNEGKVKDKLENMQAKIGPCLAYNNQYSKKPGFEITRLKYVLKLTVYFQVAAVAHLKSSSSTENCPRGVERDNSLKPFSQMHPSPALRKRYFLFFPVFSFFKN